MPITPRNWVYPDDPYKEVPWGKEPLAHEQKSYVWNAISTLYYYLDGEAVPKYTYDFFVSLELHYAKTESKLIKDYPSYWNF